MKKIKNISKKLLVFPKLDFSINSGEVKEVSEKLYLELIRNNNIEKVEKNIDKNKTNKRT